MDFFQIIAVLRSLAALGSSLNHRYVRLPMAISLALSLSRPPGAEREIIVAITSCVMVFSILAQGLTIGPLIQRARGR